MGLDMYLTKKIFIGANYDHRNMEVNIKITKEGEEIKINPKRVSYIEEAIGYWKKANHIHKWFVDNCQNGKDECQDSYVSTDDLKKLLEVCQLVKNNHSLSQELLPTQSGFFFGGTEYGEGYFQDIDQTIEIISTILDEDDLHADYHYHASW